MSDNANPTGVVRWYKKFPQLILGLIMWVLRAIVTVLFFPLRPFAAKVSKDNNRVWCTSFPKVMYAWPLVPFGIVGALLLNAGWVSPAVLGWIFIIGIGVMIVLLAEDLNIVAALVLGLILGLLFALAHVAKLQWNIPILQDIFDYFSSLNVEFTAGLGYGIAWVIGLILVAYGFPKAYITGRHELTTRGIEQVRLGRRTELTPSAGRVITVDWPDIFEFIIGFGCGSVIIKDRAGHVIKTVDNIFGLWFIHKQVTTVFEAAGVRTQHDEDDAIIAGGEA